MTPLSRKTPLARGGRIKKRARKPSEFQRVYGGKARVAWVKSLPCVASHRWCVGPIQNAHTENGGIGRKADAHTIVPACAFHHEEIHRGAETFQARHGVDLKTEAARVAAAWDAREGAC